MPKVNLDINAIENELNSLKTTVEKVTSEIKDGDSVNYASQLEVMLSRV